MRFETVGSISAIVVAVGSLFVALDEAKSVRRQQAASVLPIMVFATPYSTEEDDLSFRIDLANVGVGPAFIDHATLKWMGDEIESFEDLRWIIDEQAGENAQYWTNGLEGRIYGGDTDGLLFEVRWDQYDAKTRQAAQDVSQSLWSHLEVDVCYCSVYDRCWRTELGRLGRPDRAERCTPAEASAR